MEKIVSYFLGDVSEYKLDMRKIVVLIAGGVITLCANGFAFFNYMLYFIIEKMYQEWQKWKRKNFVGL